MDTCGTGGDNKNSFNFSTATSIVLSACDVKLQNTEIDPLLQIWKF